MAAISAAFNVMPTISRRGGQNRLCRATPTRLPPTCGLRNHERSDRRRGPRWGYAVDTVSARERQQPRSEEHTSELQSLMRSSYAVFCLKKKTKETRAHKRD